MHCCVKYISAGITLSDFPLSLCLHSLSYLFLPISTFPSLSPSPSLSQSPLPSPSPRYFYLPPPHRNKKYKKRGKQFAAFCLFMGTWPKNCATWRKQKYIEIKDVGKIKRQKNIYCHGPRPIPNVCHPPDPPRFSLQTISIDTNP